MNKTKTAAAIAILVAASTPLAQEGPLPTQPGQTGTPEVQRGLSAAGEPLFAKRVGVISYCGDLSPNAGDFGIFGRQEFFEGQNPILDATPTGYFGAQNLVDMINYDDSIPRFREVHMIDGDREQPTTAQLANNFDCVIAFTDNKCAASQQAAIYTQAANALAGFANTPGKGLVVSGMAFNTTTGFGDALFNPTLSPFRKASAALDTRCSPNQPCAIGTCPAGSERMFPDFVSAPECFACASGSVVPDPLHPGLNTCELGDFIFFPPEFIPATATNDFVCEGLLEGVNGPTSSSFASAFANPAAALTTNAVACLNYENGIPLLAVNRNRNVVGLNLIPTYARDLAKTWFSCIVANAAILACGEKRCVANPDDPTTPICR